MSRRPSPAQCVHFSAPFAGRIVKVLAAALGPNPPPNTFVRPRTLDQVHPSSAHRYRPAPRAEGAESAAAAGTPRADGQGPDSAEAASTEKWKAQEERFAAEGLCIDSVRARELVALGACYRHVINKMGVATIVRFDPAVVEADDNDNDDSDCDGDVDIEEGVYLRVYLSPKRYSSRLDASHIVRETDDFVVVNKPKGLPSVSRGDNHVENCHFLAEKLLGRTLWPVQRLDIPTQGLILFAKTKAFCKHINRLHLEQSRFEMLPADGVRKEYALIAKRCAASRPDLPADGTVVTHWTTARSSVLPKYMFDDFVEGEREVKCSLVLIQSSPIVVDGEPAAFCRVRLLTGRTHQIRAQFCQLGWPLIGDQLYLRASGAPGTEDLEPKDLDFFLRCYRLQFPLADSQVREDMVIPDGLDEL